MVKYWQKIFLSTVIVCLIVLDISILIVVSYSYSFSKNTERDSALREQSLILSSINSTIANAEKLYTGASEDPEHLHDAVEPLAKYYSSQGVSLSLYNSGHLVYSNAPASQPELLQLQDIQEKKISELSENNKLYLCVSSLVPDYSHLVFIYTRNISHILDFRSRIIHIFTIINFAVCLVLGLSIYILLKRMTQPLRQLNTITSEIAGGAYNKRVQFRRRDELGELGRTFDKMADSVEEKILQMTHEVENKQLFIENWAHEMKTPLTAILGYTALLRSAKCGEQERLIATGHLYDAAHRLQDLSAKLMDITLLEHDQILFVPVPLSSLARSLHSLMDETLHQRGLSLETDMRIDTINGDDALLLSLLINLVENAARASQPGGIITIRAYADPAVTLVVEDQGCGIAQEDIAKITEPFYRVDKSRSRENGGAGLGMYIVSRIVQLHGASLEIRSQLQRGTSVCVVFTTP